MTTIKIIDPQVEWYRPDGRQVFRKLGKCQCGCELLLSGYTNPCDCGRDYDMSGGLLADRAQWGEETGETIDEILAADRDY